MKALLSILFLICVLLEQGGECAPGAAGEQPTPEEGPRCVHNPVELVQNVQYLGSSDRRKRTTGFELLRIQTVYDASVNSLATDQRERLQLTIVPMIEEFFESSMRIIRPPANILVDPRCDGNFFLGTGEDTTVCVDQCASVTTCGSFAVPLSLQKRCIQCNGMGFSSNCETVGSDGAGLDTDFILFVGTSGVSPCGGGGSTLAFASACQLEVDLDRPIVGFINFCPAQIPNFDDDNIFRIGLHEVIHALVFSSALYPFYRDASGMPRTARDAFGRPVGGVDANTLLPITYNDWDTVNGIINHDVMALVTPNVIAQANTFFDCTTGVTGVEIENQGGSGTAGSHWEQRVLGNEGMTGSLLFNIRFSRITFGLFEDSGWYMPDYSMAEEAAWGRGLGCRFPHASCFEHVNTQNSLSRSTSPFCLTNGLRGCSVDYDHISFCPLTTHDDPLIADYQYFPSATTGGFFTLPDFCPFFFPLALAQGGDPVNRCSDLTQQPSDATNTFGLTYGPVSRCVEHGGPWTRTLAGGASVTASSAEEHGCYQYACTSAGLEIRVLHQRFLCSCEGEVLRLNFTEPHTSDVYVGSLVCPSCQSFCFDEFDVCPSPEPNACPGQITDAVPIDDGGSLDYEECCCTEYRATGGLRYACCNNLADTVTTCDGFDYGIMGIMDTCASAGVNQIADATFLGDFTCPGCDTQNACGDICDAQFLNRPCWMWTRCFRSCCNRASQDVSAQVSSAAAAAAVMSGTVDFCGDNICEGFENPMSCALDCCPPSLIDKMACVILDTTQCGGTGSPIAPCPLV